jgi:cell division protein FtsX
MWDSKELEGLTDKIKQSLEAITKKTNPLESVVTQLVQQQTPITSVNTVLNGKQAVVSIMKDDSLVVRFKDTAEVNTYFKVLIFSGSKWDNLKNAIRCLFS